MIFGVAGGMAEWLDLDPAVVRLVWALLILAGGVGLLLYVVAAIVVPEAPYAAMGAAPGAVAADNPGATTAADQSRSEARPARREARRGSGGAGMVFGLVLVLAGAWFLIERYVPAIDTGWFIPGVLIVVGIALVFGAMGRASKPGG